MLFHTKIIVEAVGLLDCVDSAMQLCNSAFMIVFREEDFVLRKKNVESTFDV